MVKLCSEWEVSVKRRTVRVNREYTTQTCQRHTPLSTPLCALCAHALSLLCSSRRRHTLSRTSKTQPLSLGRRHARPACLQPRPVIIVLPSLVTHTAGVRGRSRSPRPRRLLACCCCLVPLECVSSSSLSTSSCQSASLSLSCSPLSRSLSTTHTHTHKHKRAKPHTQKEETKRRHKIPPYPLLSSPKSFSGNSRVGTKATHTKGVSRELFMVSASPAAAAPLCMVTVRSKCRKPAHTSLPRQRLRAR